MKTKSNLIAIFVVAVALFTHSSVTLAHNSCCTIVSKGVTGSPITLDGTISPGEWAGAGAPVSLGSTSTLSGTITLLHTAAGLYVQAVIYDSTVNNNDALNLRFDLDDSGGGSPDTHDLGIQILRGGTSLALWGAANADPATWGSFSSSNIGLNPNVPVGQCPDATKTCWIVEFLLPVGPVPTAANDTFALTLHPIGVYFNVFDSSQAFGAHSASYAQWPAESGLVAPPPPPPINANTVLDSIPDGWGQLLFDPKTTFPDVSIPPSSTAVRRNNGDPSHYNEIDYKGINNFEANLNNPGGTAINDATGVQINLYTAARGISLPWKRVDTNTELTAECAAAPSAWPTYAKLAKTDVCTGTAALSLPLPDISSLLVSEVVNNTKGFTIQNGQNGEMTRSGGLNLTVPGGSNTYYPVIAWNTTPGQDNFFRDTDINGNACDPNNPSNISTCYPLHHYCIWGEAIVPNDPNPSNNGAQVNMDFSGVPFSIMLKFHFMLGWAGFAQYDPNVGRKLFLSVDRQRLDPSFKFDLTGLNALPSGGYEADLKGTLPLVVAAEVTATDAGVMGTPLKENLMVPPKAGAELEHGCHHKWWCPIASFFELFEGRDTEEPVYVKVPAGSNLWIVNYALNDSDVQYVDVDGEGPLPASGPSGLSPALITAPRGKLLVPTARVGELVLSFDNFKTGIGIDQGVQVRVPAGANYLALAINDNQEKSERHRGTGFRVKITEHALQAAGAKMEMARAAAPVAAERGGIEAQPIADVLPQVCVNGYEDTGNKRSAGPDSLELFRYLGNVCWTFTNVFPPRIRPGNDKPDKPTNGLQ